MSPSLTDLPNELLLVVLSHCTPKDRLQTLPLVSHRINELCQNPKAWERVTSLRLGVGHSDDLDNTECLQLSIDSGQDQHTKISKIKFHQVDQVVPLLRGIKTLTLSRGYHELSPPLIKNANLWTKLSNLRIKWVKSDKRNLLQQLKGVLREHAGQMQHVRVSLDLRSEQPYYSETDTDTVDWLELVADSGLVVGGLMCSGESISDEDEALPFTDLPLKKLAVYHCMFNTDKLLSALRHGVLSHLKINCEDLFADDSVSPRQLKKFLKALDPDVFSALRSFSLSVHGSNAGEYTTFRLLQATEILLGKAPTLDYLYMKPFPFPPDAPHLEQAPFVHLIRVCMDRAQAQERGMQLVMDNTAHFTDLIIPDGESPVMAAIQRAFPAPDYNLHIEADFESDPDWKLRIDHAPTGRRLDVKCTWSEGNSYI